LYTISGVSGPVTITAALTGGSATKSDHPGLPVTVEEIARSALEAHTAGASVVHLHVRGEDGRPSADVDIARRLIARVSEVCPALIQLSTGVGPDVPFEARAALVEARPTMASLNVATMSFPGASSTTAGRRAAAGRAHARARRQARARDLRHRPPADRPGVARG
jgi:uncharacterized protein (DUF849 family)